MAIDDDRSCLEVLTPGLDKDDLYTKAVRGSKQIHLLYDTGIFVAR